LTYWSAKRRARSDRSLRDDHLKVEIARVHRKNFGVYGAPNLGSTEMRGLPGCSLHRRAVDARHGLRGAVRGTPNRACHDQSASAGRWFGECTRHQTRDTPTRAIAKTAIARKLITLVYYGLRDGEIRCLNPAA
jgi:hypothetical protein